jgi:molybdate transport system ATP-binding protein
MTRLLADCRRSFADFALDARLDLELRGIACLFGPSGSGKSTLLRGLAGLQRMAGSVRFGAEVWQDEARRLFVPAHRRGVGMVFQDARLFPHLGVEGNLRYGLRRTPDGERRVGLEQVVRVLDLGPLLGRRTTALSGGERQRVALGRAVLGNPKLLLLDEPLAALDAARREEVLPFVERLPVEFGLPILYVTHAIEEVLRLAADLILIERGRIVAAGPIEEVTSRLDLHEYADRLDAGAVLRVVVAKHDPARGLTHFRFAGGELRAPLTDLREGAQVNVRIRSRDVSIALEPPRAISILNVIPGRVVRIGEAEGPQAHVLLDVGAPLWARITRASVADLRLAPGLPVYALLKAVAVDRRSLGRPDQPPP